MRDVFIVCRFAPPGSPLAAAIDRRAAWTVDQALAATRVDQANALLWSLGGGKGPRPKPVPRPWDDHEAQTHRFAAPMTTEHVDDLVARLGPRRESDNTDGH